MRLVTMLGSTVLLAGGVLAAACGGGDGGLSTEEYFRRLQAISDRVNERFDASDQEFEAAFGDIEDTFEIDERLLGVFKDFFDENVQIIADAREELDGLDPPGEVEDAHNQFRGALVDFEAALGRLAEAVAELDEPPDLEQFVAEREPDLVAIQERFSAACADFEEVAREHDFQLSLECDE